MSFLSKFLSLYSHMLWPVSCPVCGAAASLLCPDCLEYLLEKPQIPRCLHCGGPMPCRVHGEGAAVYAGAIYEGVMRDVILRLKYGGLKACGVLLGRGLGECFENPGLDALVPVPLHLDSPRRYNQTEEIALGLGDVWGVPVWRAARWRSRSKTQESKGAAARRALSSDAFEIDESVKGLRLALVDDVCTTGSTLARMAEACRLKGARVVGAFVPAQTATAKE